MDLDLVIVGGGPAGIATALFLCAAAPRLRDRIAVLEKERYPREKICAGAIGARADRLLASIGVRVDVPSVAVSGLAASTRAGTIVARDPGAIAGIGRVVRRVEFDRAFAEEARARGIRVLECARVTRVDRDARGVTIGSSLGDIRARAVVGADGIGSFVRRALGAPRGRFQAQVIEVDTEAAPGDFPRDLLHFDLLDGTLTGYAWDFPTIVDGRPLVCRGLYALDDAEADRPIDAGLDLADRLRARLKAQGLSAEGLRFKRFAERGLALHEPLAVERALLVGEAAGIDPVLGEGIAQAIFYGATAGPYLARCLDRDELGFQGWKEAVTRSRVGLDIRLRTLGLPWIYGRPRPFLERLIAGSPALALAGMRYFAGERVPRAAMARASVDAGRALAAMAFSPTSSAASSSRGAAYRRSR
ncbi:MAG: NAD(P)/FAD-dependent oxidoreductase [Byssovorax sp.]